MRSRTTALAAVVVFVVLTATAAAVVVAHRRALVEAIEESLTTTADGVVALWAAGRAQTPLPVFGDDDAFAQIVDTEGRVIASSSTLAAVDKTAVAATPTTGRAWRTVSVPAVDDAPFRVLSVTARAGDRVVFVHAGAPLDDVNDSAALLVRVLAVAIPLATATLAVSIWGLVGRTLRPVEDIRRGVSAIGPRDLHRRVPEPRVDDEIGRLARTMNAMLGRVEDAARRQQQFIADASHELRSPLTRIRSEVEVDLAHPHTADLLATHRSVLEETAKLQRLVGDLLILARSEAGASDVARAAVDVRALMAHAALSVRSAGLEVIERLNGPVIVEANEAQVGRAIQNVVANAVRHARSRVELALAVDGDHVSMRITDDGPGVPPGERERIFERFTRLDESRTAASGGAGLGLAIARDVIERHGGAIAIDPNITHGASFVLTIPVGAP